MKKQISTNEAPAAPHIVSQGIVANGFVFVSGQVHNSPDGKIVGSTVRERLDQIMRNIQNVLAASNASLNDIVKVTIYVTDMGEMPEINEAYPKYFSGQLPAREAICVKALPLGATIEISVVATVADDK